MRVFTSKMLDICTGKPRLVYLILSVITLLVASQLPRIQIDTDPENMLDTAHPARVFHNDVKQKFSLYDAIVVGVVNESEQGIYTPSTLTAIFDLTESIMTIEGVVSADVMSISTVDNITQEGPGTIRFEWMMSRAPTSDAVANQIKQNLVRLPLLKDTLAASSGKAAAIYVPIADKNESYPIAEQIRALIQNMGGNEQWYITGLPVAEDQFGFEMFVQMGISAPLAGLAIFVLLFVFFRNIPLIIAPMVVAITTVIIVMGVLIGMGFTVHIMSSMIAIFLMPIAVVDSVHILSEFSDRYKPGADLNKTIRQVITHLFTPMLFTSITSAVGFFSLILTPIPPVQIFGAFVGSGILLAFIVTITYMPAYLSRMNEISLARLQRVLHKTSDGSRIARTVRALGQIAQCYPAPLLLLFSMLFVVSVWGIQQIQINDNPTRWFKSDHEIRIADTILNEHFAGTYDAYLVFTDQQPITAPAKLLDTQTTPDSLRQWLTTQSKQLDALPANEQLQGLIMGIDDKLFEVERDVEIVWLEQARQIAEQAESTSKRFLSPDVLGYLDKLQIHLQQSGLMGKSNSLPDIVKTVNRELHSGRQKDFVLPQSSQGVAQALLQYQSSHRPDDLWHFVTPDYRKSLIWLQLTSGDNQDMSRVVALVDEYVKSNPLPDSVTLNWAGKAYLNVVWQDNMVTGMLESLLWAFVIVLIMMVILFRSLVFGVLAMLPLTITITFIYGLIGIVGKDYDMPIAVLSALTLGLSVDFAIHFIERTRAIYAQTRDLSESLEHMFNEPATAITRNALVIALGFTPLLFAPLVPYVTVGVFLASIMAISALVTLLILPGVMLKGHKYIFPSKPETSANKRAACE